jgi:hypothetical protein
MVLLLKLLHTPIFTVLYSISKFSVTDPCRWCVSTGRHGWGDAILDIVAPELRITPAAGLLGEIDERMMVTFGRKSASESEVMTRDDNGQKNPFGFSLIHTVCTVVIIFVQHLR